MRGLTRIINGDAWKRRSTSGKQFGVPDVSVDVSLGIRTLELKDEILDKGVGLASEINIEYGDRFDAEDTKPYDYFSIQANLNWQKDQPVLGQINIVGRLVAKELVNTSKHYLSLGLYQHFDYYDSDTISAVSAKVPYKFCTPASVGGGLIYKRNLKRNWGIDGYAYLNAILRTVALSIERFRFHFVPVDVLGIPFPGEHVVDFVDGGYGKTVLVGEVQVEFATVAAGQVIDALVHLIIVAEGTSQKDGVEVYVPWN